MSRHESQPPFAQSQQHSETQNFETIERPISRAPIGLLQAVLCNPELRRKFDRIPPAEKTIELSSDSHAEIADPSWKVGDMDSAEFETVEAPSDEQPFAPTPMDKGFVPQRRLAKFSDEIKEDIDYRIVGQLGRGGTGVVYQAHQRAIDREVALKILREELVMNQASRERFLAEARVIGGLDHPNVIALHEVCVDDSGGLFYSMKRVDGTSWDKQLASMTLEQNISTLLRAADAIRYAHSQGLIHRDVKPENVMLGRFGEVLLADWGLAINCQGDESSLGLNQAIGGTPAYMAPELASGKNHAICFQTDVYLLGAVLFQILTGFPPHQGKTLLACIHAAAHNEIRPTTVEGELMDIARKAMATHPEDRFESVDAFVAAIRYERKHQDSARLVRRACERFARAGNANQYQDFRLADALLTEALALWPENSRAHKARKRLQMQFAKSAAERGDFDLAISLYDAAGQGGSDEANEVRDLLARRETSHQRVSRYSALFTQSPEAGLLIDLSTGSVVEANEMFAILFGYREEEVVGRRIAELNLWACPQRRAQLVDDLHRNGAIDNFEAVFLRTDGREIDVLISGKIVDVDGQQMVVATIRDISLRKQAENELRKHRQRLHDLQRLAGLATWSYDVVSGGFTWSDEACQMAGRAGDQTVPSKEHFYEMIHPQDRDELKRTIREAIESGSAYELIIRQQGAGGKYKRVIVRGQPIFDGDGKTIEVYGVLIPQKA